MAAKTQQPFNAIHHEVIRVRIGWGVKTKQRSAKRLLQALNASGKNKRITIVTHVKTLLSYAFNHEANGMDE